MVNKLEPVGVMVITGTDCARTVRIEIAASAPKPAAARSLGLRLWLHFFIGGFLSLLTSRTCGSPARAPASAKNSGLRGHFEMERGTKSMKIGEKLLKSYFHSV